MHPTIKSLITCFAAISISNPLLAVEDCTFAHTMSYLSTERYHQTEELGQVSIHLMFETNAQLFRRAKSGPVIFELAEHVEYSPDKKTMYITLRNDCGWSNGSRITAEEVVRGLTNVFTENPDLYVPGKNFIANGYEVTLGEVDVSKLGIRVDEKGRVEIAMNAAGDLVQQILTRFNFAPYPLHLKPEQQIEWERGDLRRLSSGPFVATSFDAEQIYMERNPHFCKGIQPQIENILVINSTKTSEQIGLFFNGTINVAERFAARDFDALQQREGTRKSRNYKEREMNDEIVEYLIEAKGSVFEKQPHLRSAVLMAIDGDRMASITGGAIETSSLSHPYEGYKTKTNPLFIESYPQRILTARKIMEAAGYSRENPLEIKIALRTGFNNQQMASALVGMWSQIHVRAKTVITVKKKTDLGYLDNEAYRDYFLLAIGSDYSDPSDFITSIAQYGQFDHFEKIQKRVEDTFQISDQSDRWGKLADIDHELINVRRALALNILTTPWILSNDLELGKYFNLTASNLNSSTCVK